MLGAKANTVVNVMAPTVALAEKSWTSTPWNVKSVVLVRSNPLMDMLSTRSASNFTAM
jgi:hypothetical protein